MNTFISAVLVGLVGVFCMWDSRLLGRLNFEQPLVGATLVGLLLGDVPPALPSVPPSSSCPWAWCRSAPPFRPIWSWAHRGRCLRVPDRCFRRDRHDDRHPVAVLGQLLGIVFRSIIAALTHVADSAIDNASSRPPTVCTSAPLRSVRHHVLPADLPAVFVGTDLSKPSSTWFPSGCPLV